MRRIAKIWLFLIDVLLSSTLLAQHVFVENKGQWPSQVLFSSEFEGGRIFIETDGYTVHLFSAEGPVHPHSHLYKDDDIRFKGHVYHVKWKGKKIITKVATVEPVETKYNFFLLPNSNNWGSDCMGFKEIVQYNIFPGISIRWKIINGKIKFDFNGNQGAKIKDVNWEYVGLDNWKVQKDEISIYSSFGEVKENIPLSFSQSEKIEVEYVKTDQWVGFRGPSELKNEWTIDPNLIFSTYSGSVSDNFGYSATYDDLGYLYSGSSAFGINYPTTTGAYQTTWAGGDGSGTLAGTDIAVTKYSLDGTTRIWSTYVGGSGDDLPHSMIVNDNNELIIYGSTGSSDFPIVGGWDSTFDGGSAFTPQGVGTSYPNGSDAFLLRFNNTGSSLLNASFIGGSENDGVNLASGTLKFNYADEFRGEVDILNDGRVVVIGTTLSSDFPVVSTSLGFHAGQDAFVMVWSPAMNTVEWSCLIGGSLDESGCSVTEGVNGEIIVCGGTESDDLSVSAGSFQQNYQGGTSDGWIAKLSSSGVMEKLTYTGSSSYDQWFFIETDTDGSIVLLGQSLNTTGFWVQNVLWSQLNSGIVVSKFNLNLDQMVWSTTIGNGLGVPNLSPAAFLVDVCGRIYISGWGGTVNNMFNPSTGNTLNLWVSPNAYQSVTTGNDFYLMILNPEVSSPYYATFFGGPTSAEHVDGGTSRFDHKGIIYQSVCAGCGNHDDFPIYPSNAVSPINASNNCNNGVFKFNFELPMTVAVNSTWSNLCLGDTLPLIGWVSSGAVAHWWVDDQEFSTELESSFVPTDTGWVQILLIAEDLTTCNQLDSSLVSVHVGQSINQTLDSIFVCENESVVIGIAPEFGATYHWNTATGLSDSTLSNPLFIGNESMNYILNVNQFGCEDEYVIPVIYSEIDIIPLVDTVLCNTSSVVMNINNVNSELNISWFNGLGQLLCSGSECLLEINDSINYVIQYEYNGCLQLDSVWVTSIENVVNLGDDHVECFNQQNIVHITTENNQFQYNWDSNANLFLLSNDSVEVTIMDTTWVSCQLEIGNCIASDTCWILPSNWNLMSLSLSAIPNQVAQFDAVNLVVTPNPDWVQWYTHGSTWESSNNPTQVFPEFSGWYYLISGQGDCSRLDSVFIRVEKTECQFPYLFVPNAFSPNDDGENDVVYVHGLQIQELNWRIFDRWGELVFETNDKNVGWDGFFKNEKLKNAVFHYTLDVKCFGGVEQHLEGNISLLLHE
jgi:gliding motility-associated-like protein